MYGQLVGFIGTSEDLLSDIKKSIDMQLKDFVTIVLKKLKMSCIFY